MKFGRLILLLMVLFPQLIIAQVITVSDEIPLRNSVSYELIGELRDQVLLLQSRPNDFEVLGFNQALRQNWSKKLDLDKRQPKIIGVIGDRYDFSIVYRHRLKGRTIVKVHKYDPGANLKDSVTIKDFGFLFYTPEFEVLRSEDRSKLMIYYLEKSKILNTIIFDLSEMKVLSERAITPDDMDFNFEFVQALVSDNGDFAFILSKDNFRSRRKEHTYQIHEFKQTSQNQIFYEVPLSEYLTYDVFFNYDNLNDALVAGGLYAEKNLAKANGFFFLKIPSDDPARFNITFEEFDDTFVSSLMGKEIDDNKGIMETSVQDLVLRQDGGLLMICERNRQFQRKSSSASGRLYYDYGGRFLVDYYYDDVFVVSIHPDGETHWKTILPKKQFSQDDNGVFSSFFLFKTQKNIKFLFNDEIKNENTVSEYVIVGDGSFNRNSILNTENLELKLRFRDAVQIDSDELLVPSERKNRLKLVKLEY